MKTLTTNSYVTGILAAYDRQPDGNIKTVYVTGFDFDEDGLLTTTYGPHKDAYVFNLAKEYMIVKSIEAQISDLKIDLKNPSFVCTQFKPSLLQQLPIQTPDDNSGLSEIE